MKRWLYTAAALAATLPPYAHTQTPCKGSALWGTVKDTTQALIPGAALVLDGIQAEASDSKGQYVYACVSAGPHKLVASAQGFAERAVNVTLPHAGSFDLVLRPEGVETQVEVDADTASEPTATSSGPSQTIGAKQLQQLADDPDDLLRELQQLAAAAGGSPGNATVAVDGFQDSSALPPKSSIAYIKVNPDLYSSEYREPPFGGGRIEIYTKPGQTAYHGALFLTNGSPWENARDPFSTSKAALGKQRYGLEFSGPVRKVGSDFALTLEHRSIDNFAAVNAVTLDGPETANVAQPQRLWLATARVDWQLGPKNSFTTSYSANVNHLVNVGVGGTTLAEAGYDSQTYEHMLRFSNITTASAHLMHESRLSLRWDGETDTPNSYAPQLQVAGAFTGGGATIGAQHLREFNVEFGDDAILTTKSHTFKFGDQTFLYDEHPRLTTNFNGTYVFTNLAQYQAATPTAFTDVVGDPEVAYTGIQDALFFQDEWTAGHGVKISYGVRYYLQNGPTTFNGLQPRLGILWSPNKKGTWTIHAHSGMFTTRVGPKSMTELKREDGVERVTSTIYNPVYGNPFLNATPIHSVRQLQPGFQQGTYAIQNIGVTRLLPFGFNLSADYYFGRFWNMIRSNNINSPRNGVPTGPRPGAPNLNVLQMQNSASGWGNVEFMGLEQHTMKHVTFFFGCTHVDLFDDNDDTYTFTPQSSTSNAGEFAHRTNNNVWQIFGNSTITLPEKVQLSSDFHGGGDARYNITTGYDNNGDGNFNDRPQYAAPGTLPGTPGTYQTPFGLLVASGGTGVLPRNSGVFPWNFHLDMNIQRVFPLTHDKKAEHPQAVTLNLRSSNVLNHTNVTAMGGVLGSPLFGVPYAADNGRRIEAGLRYSF